MSAHALCAVPHLIWAPAFASFGFPNFWPNQDSPRLPPSRPQKKLCCIRKWIRQVFGKKNFGFQRSIRVEYGLEFEPPGASRLPPTHPELGVLCGGTKEKVKKNCIFRTVYRLLLDKIKSGTPSPAPPPGGGKAKFFEGEKKEFQQNREHKLVSRHTLSPRRVSLRQETLQGGCAGSSWWESRGGQKGQLCESWRGKRKMGALSACDSEEAGCSWPLCRSVELLINIQDFWAQKKRVQKNWKIAQVLGGRLKKLWMKLSCQKSNRSKIITYI